MKQLIMHSLRMHKIQSASIVVSVALSAMILVTFGLVYGGVSRGVEAAKAQGGADVMAVPQDALQYITDTELLYTGAPAAIYMDESIVDKIAEAEGAVRISPQFFSQTLNQACCSSTGETRLIGIDPETDFVVRGLAGNTAVSSLGENDIILGSAVDGMYDGKFSILGNQYNVLRIMAETGTEFDSSIVCSIDTAREISRNIEGYDHYWEKYGDPSGLVSCVMIDVVDDDPDEAALTKVKAKINLSGVATPLVRSQIVERSWEQLQSVFLLLIVAAVIMVAEVSRAKAFTTSG